MSADYALLTNHLRHFYDFTGKVVLFVGAAGRQLLDPSIRTKKLIAIDQNVEALKQLQAAIAAGSIQNELEIVATKFESVMLRGDVVYFEFCLHEMADPRKVLEHARTLAPDAVVFDHAPGSPWSFHAAEDDLVRRSANAMKCFGIRNSISFHTEQRFTDCAELLEKISPQGPIAVQRSERFAGAKNIVIPMDCELVLL